jgi:DNA invertase Pin-like site-specific DNA recombinase
MNITYGRISTVLQNDDRQKTKGYKAFIDTCSGVVPFFERPQAKKLIQFLKLNPEATTNILAVDRLGRNLKDILNTVEYFQANNYNLSIDNLGINSNSPFFKMMISIIGTLSEHERETIKERCAQGIAVAKSEGKYPGRQIGTKDNRTKVLSKHSDIVLCLNQKMKISDIARVTNKTRATIYKVKKVV